MDPRSVIWPDKLATDTDLVFLNPQQRGVQRLRFSLVSLIKTFPDNAPPQQSVFYFRSACLNELIDGWSVVVLKYNSTFIV